MITTVEDMFKKCAPTSLYFSYKDCENYDTTTSMLSFFFTGITSPHFVDIENEYLVSKDDIS